jgi:hypothetical protein
MNPRDIKRPWQNCHIAGLKIKLEVHPQRNDLSMD